jgi:hypothetical protein
MKAEYDFSAGERGKFYNSDTEFSIPIYLEPDVDEFIRRLASEKGKDAEQLVNEWLRHDIRLVQSAQ